MTIQLTYTGSKALFAVDIKYNEDRPLRIDLPRNVATTVTGFAFNELNGLPQWEDLLALSDITLTLSGTDAPVYEYSVAFTAPGAVAARDVTLFASAVPFAAQIVGVHLALSTSAAITHTLRDTAGGAGTAVSLVMTGTGVAEDLQGTKAPVQSIAKSSSLYLRTSSDTTAGTLFVTLRRVGK